MDLDPRALEAAQKALRSAVVIHGDETLAFMELMESAFGEDGDYAKVAADIVIPEIVNAVVAAYLSASGSGSAVRVKPLEWVLSWGPDEEGDESHTAGTPFGSYTVERLDGRWRWKYCFDEYYDEETSDCDGLEDGKAKSQAHWSERISPIFLPTEVSPHGRAITLAHGGGK